MSAKNGLYVGGIVIMLVALCLLISGALLYLGSFAETGDPGWRSSGILTAGAGFLIMAGGAAVIVMGARKAKQEAAQNITLKVDLPGQVAVEKIKCQSCGGVLSAKDIQVVAGAPIVNCPYCQTTYQLTEEPKW